MRPHLLPLPCTARLRIPTPLRHSVCGARNYSRAVQSSCSRPSHPSNTQVNRISLIPGHGAQKRCITRAVIQRRKDAEAEWAGLAEEIKAGKRKSFVEHLEERGLIHDVVGERDLLHKVFTEKRAGMYVGIDPTAPSMHVGHMLPFMVLAWGYVWGLPVTFLLGGATCKVGDPTGRTEGRAAVHSSVQKANMASMHMQLKKLGASIHAYGERHGYKRQAIWKRALTNNNMWWNKIPFTDVIRCMGSGMRLGPMLGRDTVKTRLESGSGMSFAEFTYPIMQAWDWFTLFTRNNVQVQVGGSDQYGNILFGIQAVKTAAQNTIYEKDRNMLNEDVDKPIGFTTPLLTAPSGEKFGKSAGNAVWLDKDMTSTFELYQFFVRTPDDTVERYLKLFTFLPLPEIASIMEEQNKDPSKRVAQHALASEFVELLHGKQEAEAVATQHRQLFRPRSSTAEPTPLPHKLGSPHPKPTSPVANFWNPGAGNKHAPQSNFATMGNLHVTLPRSLVYDNTFNRVLWSAGLVSSRSEGHRLIVNKGVSVGSRPGDSGTMGDDLTFTPIQVWDKSKTQEYVQEDNIMFLKVGKWKLKIVHIIPDEDFIAQGLTAPGWEPEGESTESSDSTAQRREAIMLKDATPAQNQGGETRIPEEPTPRTGERE